MVVTIVILGAAIVAAIAYLVAWVFPAGGSRLTRGRPVGSYHPAIARKEEA